MALGVRPAYGQLQARLGSFSPQIRAATDIYAPRVALFRWYAVLLSPDSGLTAPKASDVFASQGRGPATFWLQNYNEQ